MIAPQGPAEGPASDPREEARQAVIRGDPKAAALSWRALLEQAPEDEEGRRGLARALDQLGEVEAALELWEAVPADVESMAAVARGRAEADPSAARRALERVLDLGGVMEGPVCMRVAGQLREKGDEEGAVALWTAYLRSTPDGPFAAEARGRLDRAAVERSARLLSIIEARPLLPEQRDRLEEARQALARGGAEQALPRIQALVDEAPRSAEARAALGDALAALGQVGEAERQYSWAEALAPDEARHPARLGALLAARYGGRRDAEAAEAFVRALALQPDDAELRAGLARLRQRQGEFGPALLAWKAVLQADPPQQVEEEARQAIEDLGRAAPAPPALPVDQPPDGVAAEAIAAFQVARVYLDRGEVEAARAELLVALRRAPQWSAPWNLKAGLALEAGEAAEARESWMQSLGADPQQPDVMLALGRLERRLGREAEGRRWLVQGAQQGSAEAWVDLALLALDERPLMGFVEAREALGRAERAGARERAPEALARAERLVERMERRLALLGGGLLACLPLGLGLWLWRRRPRPHLADLVRQSPQSAREVARVLHAVRHEVLKHNTTLLDEVAEALERGDDRLVAYAALRLYGDPAGGSRGAQARYGDDLDRLEALGRAAGLDLDLRRRDPLLAPLWAELGRLQALETDLRRPGRRRGATAQALRALSIPLNGLHYQALGRFLASLHQARLEPAWLRGVEARLLAEPGPPMPALELILPDPPPAARVLPGDLEDVLVNLLRNARGAMAELPAPAWSLRVELEEDEITGLCEVALRLCDRAPGRLRDEELRQRSAARGLGLVVDLLARHEGRICVEQRSDERALGYEKALVVRLPMAERMDLGPAPPTPLRSP